jgi:hypothetical protein
MKKLALAVALFSLPLFAYAQDWANVALLDRQCHKAGEDKNVETHTKQCLIHCAKSGFGIIDAEGKWIALDKKGNKLVLTALKKTQKADHLHVNVTGELKGESIVVKKLALAE